MTTSTGSQYRGSSSEPDDRQGRECAAARDSCVVVGDVIADGLRRRGSLWAGVAFVASVRGACMPCARHPYPRRTFSRLKKRPVKRRRPPC